MSSVTDLYRTRFSVIKETLSDISAPVRLGWADPRGIVKAMADALSDVQNASAYYRERALTIGYEVELMEVLALLEWLKKREARLILDDNLFAVRAALSEIGFTPFAQAWKVARQLIPLQARLLVEQALWDLAPPWSDLVTGFRPIGVDIPGYDYPGYTPPGSGGGKGVTPLSSSSSQTSGGGTGGARRKVYAR